MRMMSLGVSERQPGTAQRPLPRPHEIEMRGEAHLGRLLEHDAKARARAHRGAGRRRSHGRAVLARGAAAERLRGLASPRQIERGVRLLDPRPLRALDDAARETHVLEPAVLGDAGLLGALPFAHEELLGHG
jgi:hypothetical protein